MAGPKGNKIPRIALSSLHLCRATFQQNGGHSHVSLTSQIAYPIKPNFPSQPYQCDVGHTSQVDHYPSFCSIGRDASPSHARRVTPSIKFAGTHLCTWVERGTVGVKCLVQEYNAISPGLNPDLSIQRRAS